MNNNRFYLFDDIRDLQPYFTRSNPPKNNETYNKALGFINRYYPYTIIFEDPYYDYKNFSAIFENYKKQKEQAYYDLLQTYVAVKKLKTLSDEYGKNYQNNPYIMSLVDKLKQLNVGVHDLLMTAYENGIKLDDLDISNLYNAPVLQDFYLNIDKKASQSKKLEENRKVSEEPLTDKDALSDKENVFPSIENYYKTLHAESEETVETKQENGGDEMKRFISLRDSAEQCKPYVERTNHYYNDTDDYETEEEFKTTLRGIKAREEAIDDFIKAFNDSRVMEEYYYEKPDQYQDLAQKYKNYLYLGQPNIYYSRDNAEENNEISSASYDFYEAINKFLRDFASERLTPIEKLALSENLQDYFDSLDSQK